MTAKATDSESIVALLGDLVRIPSVNPAIAPEEGRGEEAVARFACEWLARHGVEAWLETPRPGRPNAVARAGSGHGPTLVLCAHLDTVGTAGMSIPPFEPRVEGERLFGRGSYDMKGGAAAVMWAAAELARRDLAGEVLLALVADEEYESFGAEDFVSRHRADGCIVTEPSEGRLILAHKGFVWAEIVTAGHAAHGSAWDLGISAISRMGRILVALDTFDRDVLRRREHSLVGPASLHCALVSGGVGLSTYAPECRLKVERRTLPGEDPVAVIAELEHVVRDAGEAAEVRRLFDRSPLTCDRDSAIARSVREAVAHVTGAPPPEAGVAYWMDAAIFAAAGIPTVNYGPSGAGAHEAVEWVDVRSVESCSRVLIEAALRFCAQQNGAGSAPASER
ncbi:MAG TPA: M20/M25/M40 family metallo-hydrolase [Candidatus Limnocylindria bacterium]|nr:M20/M25/M40 family metallo-hydrolase [Candidatus Limnocylindria bacterium]